jgi:hypothetical protein
MITRSLLLVATLLCVAAPVRNPGNQATGLPLTDSLPSPAGPGSAEPNLAVGQNGRVYLTWLEPRDSAFSLRISSFDGSAWSAPTTIRSGRDFFVNWADFPSVAVSLDGRLAVHWLQRTGQSTYAYGVRMAQSRDGGLTWSAPIRPHSDSSNTEHGFVALWPEQGGAIGAAWLDGRKFNKEGHNPSNEMTVMSATVDRSGRTSSEVLLDPRACDCCQTSAAMTSRGPIIAYRDRSADEIRDIVVVRRVNGKWTAPATVHPDNWKIAACPVNGPAVSARGNRVALAWFTAANDSARVKLAFSTDAGARFRAPIRIDEGAPAGRVDVELLADGGALVTWIERTGGDIAAVRLQRVHADGKTGAPLTIAASTAARASGFPRMAISGEHAIFAWTVPGRPSAVRIARMKVADIR